MPVTLDLHTTGDGLDFTSQQRLKDYATVYKERGHGPITMVISKSQGTDSHSVNMVAAVKRELVAEGLRTNLNVSYAAMKGGNSFAPIHFEFEALTAQPLSQCGQWPSDLASAGSLEGLENRPYWNFGCSAQSNLATLVADPRDLISPRGEAPNDVSTRTRTITSIRAGQDPATNWTVKNSSIGAAGG
jgi:pilus assembly protein CpaD